MPDKTLDQWLDWQTMLHDRAIDLGLDRVRAVGDRMGIGKIAGQVVTVAGTNGKGSTVRAYETWLRNAGFEVASYTSPHLLRYNERIRRNLVPVEDAVLCEAFAAVEAARGDIALTYFEFGTLAALNLIQGWQPDYALLEVGLGGRLDAVNIVDADLAHLTQIGIDHQAWLGSDREQIGYEKAGVLRDGITVVVNDADPPLSVLGEIERRGCHSLLLGWDYDFEVNDDKRIAWHSDGLDFEFECRLPGSHQAANLAGVVAGLSQLPGIADFDQEHVDENFSGLRIAGRFETLPSGLACRLIVDVGHNPDAAQALRESLDRERAGNGRTVVLLGMLEDKEPELFVEALAPAVDAWWLLTLDGDRGLDAASLRDRIGPRIEPEALFETPEAALDRALSSLGNRDIMLVTGSFVTVERLLLALPDSGNLNENGTKP